MLIVAFLFNYTAEIDIRAYYILNTQQGIAPGAVRRYAPAADGSSTVVKIAADLRPSTDESAVRTSLVDGGAKLQAASVPIA